MSISEKNSPRKANPFSITLPEFLAGIPALFLFAGAVISSAQLLIISIWGTLLILAVNFMLFRTRLPLETPIRYTFYVAITIAVALTGWGFVEHKNPLFTAGSAACTATIILAYIFPRGNPVALQIYGKNSEFPWLVPIFHSAVALAITGEFAVLVLKLFRMAVEGKIPLAFVWLTLGFGLSGAIFLIAEIFYPRSFPWVGRGFGSSYSWVRPYIAGFAVLILLSASSLGVLVAYFLLHPVAPGQNQPQGARAAITKLERTTPFS